MRILWRASHKDESPTEPTKVLDMWRFVFYETGLSKRKHPSELEREPLSRPTGNPPLRDMRGASDAVSEPGKGWASLDLFVQMFRETEVRPGENPWRTEAADGRLHQLHNMRQGILSTANLHQARPSSMFAKVQSGMAGAKPDHQELPVLRQGVYRPSERSWYQALFAAVRSKLKDQAPHWSHAQWSPCYRELRWLSDGLRTNQPNGKPDWSSVGA